ncbi:flagellin [Virgibacillus sp. L01]
MNESHSILQRMRELAVQSANDTNTDSDRAEMQKEVNQLASALTDISEDTEFNTKSLLDGNFEGKFQVGANADQNVQVSIGDMSASELNATNNTAITSADGGTTNLKTSGNSDLGNLKTGEYTAEVSSSGVVTLNNSEGTKIGSGTLSNSGTSATINVTNSGSLIDTTNATISVGISDTDDTAGVATDAGTISIETTAAGEGGINISTQDKANSAITTLDSAIENVSAERSKLGAIQNRLDHTINNLGASAENLTAAESRIRDVDMAKEMMNFTKNNILSQAAQSMLAQANQQPQGVLQLLR